MALNPTKTASNPRIAKLIELEVAGRIKPEHQQELDTYRAQGLAPARAGADLTENQSKSTGFYNRALGSNADYEATGVARDPQNIVAQGIEHSGLRGFANVFYGDERQKAIQAKEDFIRASLRYESGAAIGPDEFSSQDRIFFPQAGDGQEVIEQKALSRRRVIDSLKVSSGEGAEQLGTPQSIVPQGTLVPADQAPQQAAGVSELTGEQTAALQAVAQSGGTPEQIVALARSFGRNVSAENAAELAKFYANPANRNVRPVVNDDTTIKPVDAGDGALGAAARGAGDTLTFGFLDEAGALADTVTRGGTYDEALNRRRGMALYDQQNSGGSRLAGQLVGGLALPSFGASGVRQLAALGAGYGGAYGFGSTDGGVGERLQSAGLGAAAGGAVGGGLGWLGGAVANRLGRNPPGGGGGAELLAAAQRQGVEVLPADVGGAMTRRFTAGAVQTPFGSGPIVRAADRAQTQAGNRLAEIAAAEGAPLRQEALGEVGQRAAQSYIDTSGRAARAAYDGARELAGEARLQGTQAIANIDSQLAELSATSNTDAPLIAGLERLRGDLATEGDASSLTIDAIRRLRTSTRAEAQSEGLRSTDYQRRSGQVLDALSADIEAQLPPEAARAFRQADRDYAERLSTIDDVMSEVIGPSGDRSAEAVARRLGSLARGDSARLARFLNSVDPESAGTVRGSLINEIGRANSGGQNAAGDAFSFQTFLSNWDKLPNRTRDLLFRGEHRQAIEDLARVAEGARAARGYANTSGTAGATNSSRFVTEAGRLTSTGGALATFGGTAILENLTGRLLASRRFTQLLARPPRDRGAVVRRLGVIASREPAIANDLVPIQQALQTSLPRAAASENEQNRR